MLPDPQRCGWLMSQKIYAKHGITAVSCRVGDLDNGLPKCMQRRTMERLGSPILLSLQINLRMLSSYLMRGEIRLI